MTSQHQVNAFDTAHPLRLQLRIATSHHDKGIGMFAHHAVDGLPAFVVGHVGYGASVDEADVSFLAFLGSHHTHVLKRPPEGGSLREVQLAA